MIVGKIGMAAAAFAILATLPAFAQNAAVSSPTLEAVKQRGVLNCGVFGNSPGYSLPDSQGIMRGIDADQCRAIAAATLGDASKVKYIVLTPAQRLTAIQSGEVDVLFAGVTWTYSREAKSGLLFIGPYSFSGQGFLVRKETKITKAAELDGASICVLGASTPERALQDYFAINKMTYNPVVLDQGEAVRAAFLANRCDAILNDVTALAVFRMTQGDKADDYVILPELVTREIISGVVRKGDDVWFDIARWTHYAMVEAEVLGITKENFDSFANSTNPRVRILLGAQDNLGEAMGLSNDWAANVISQVGNYGQVWESAFHGLPRGMNKVWTDGGLQYVPTFQ